MATTTYKEQEQIKSMIAALADGGNLNDVRSVGALLTKYAVYVLSTEGTDPEARAARVTESARKLARVFLGKEKGWNGSGWFSPGQIDEYLAEKTGVDETDPVERVAGALVQMAVDLVEYSNQISQEGLFTQEWEPTMDWMMEKYLRWMIGFDALPQKSGTTDVPLQPEKKLTPIIDKQGNAAGRPCKPGQNPDRDDCIPADESGGSGRPGPGNGDTASADATPVKPAGSTVRAGLKGEVKSTVVDQAEAEKKKVGWFGKFFKRPDQAALTARINERAKELQSYRPELANQMAEKRTKERKRSSTKSVNTVYFELKEDGTKTVFKPEAKESLAPSMWYDGDVSEAAREVAAFKLSEVLGTVDLTPATQWADNADTEAGDRETGRATVQEFVAGVDGHNYGSGLRSAITSLDKDMAKRVVLFDLLTGNNDRHGGNWFMNGSDHIHLIDNGRAFPDRDTIDHYTEQGWYGPMVNETVPDLVGEWYDKRDEIDAVLKENGMTDTARKGVQKRLKALNDAKGKKFGNLTFKTDDNGTLDYGQFYGRGWGWKG